MAYYSKPRYWFSEEGSCWMLVGLAEERLWWMGEAEHSPHKFPSIVPVPRPITYDLADLLQRKWRSEHALH